MNLFELGDAYKSVLESKDLDPQAMADTLDAIKDARDVKLDNIAKLITKLKGQTEELSDKAKSFREEAAYRKNKVKFLTKYLTDFLDEQGIKKIDTENFILTTRNNKQSTIIDDESKLPEEYLTTKTETRPDKTKLYKAMKDGQMIPGAHLEPNRGTVIK